MNKPEARHLLIEYLRPYLRWSYDRLRALVGSEHVREIQGASGTSYFFEVYVSPVNETADDLDVEGFISEVHGRRWLPPMLTATFGISSDGRVSSRTPELSEPA